MKLPFKITADEIQRGLIILGLSVILGVVIGLVRFCDVRAGQEEMTRLPDYNPFARGTPPLIDSPTQYSDFLFTLEGIPRFLPPWRVLLRSEEVLAAQDWEREWDLLGDPLRVYPDDRDLERALDEALIDR